MGEALKTVGNIRKYIITAITLPPPAPCIWEERPLGRVTLSAGETRFLIRRTYF